jgi:RimJ/RimL family protein N-acetyltransferase
MKWRNDQIYHLRQKDLLTRNGQDAYFNDVVSKLFVQLQPNQILFSFFQREKCVGYGGLVHINWIDMNAEVSFLMDTELEKDNFSKNWVGFLNLIKQVSFNELRFHKIYTYAFDLRPILYTVLASVGFVEDARLKQHAIFQDKAIDVVIHSMINTNLLLRKANKYDLDSTYLWTTDPNVRKYSFNQGVITKDHHTTWFCSKIMDQNCFYYILEYGAQKIGSIRIDYNPNLNEGVISYLISTSFHGNGFGLKILQLAEKEVKDQLLNKELVLIGYILQENIASIKIFEKLEYSLNSNENGVLKYIKKIKI